MAALILGAANPARAGHYELDAGMPTGSGTQVTTASPGSPSWPSTITQQLTALTFGGEANRGTIVYSASDTYRFHWVTDAGMSITDDPPVTDVWEVPYTIQINGSYAANSNIGGSMNGTVTITSDQGGGSYSASGTGTPLIMDPNAGQPSSSWAWNPTTPVGDSAISVQLILEGEAPAITVTGTGSGTAVDDVSLAMNLISGSPAAKKEAIWHKYPGVNKTFSTGAPITPNGIWRGFTNTNYKIKCLWKGPSSSGSMLGWRGPAAGVDNTSLSWDGYPIPLDVDGVYNSIAELWRAVEGVPVKKVADQTRPLTASSAAP